MSYLYSFIAFCSYISLVSANPPVPIILVHSGAGEMGDSKVQGKINGVKAAAVAGYNAMVSGGSAVDAVEAAINVMEDDEAMNTGRGSVLNMDGEVEMDASIMSGKDLSAGAVTAIKNVAHPVSVARLVMENTKHVLLVGEGANRFADSMNVTRLRPGALVTQEAIDALEYVKKHPEALYGTEVISEVSGGVGTVGAVALDPKGHLAAATSTGGLNGKMPGRGSDSSAIGSGTYADNNIGAASATGNGESIIKVALTHSIMNAMELGMDPMNATNLMLRKMYNRLAQTAGVITLNKWGEVGVGFTASRMGWAYIRGNEVCYGINQEEKVCEEIK